MPTQMSASLSGHSRWASLYVAIADNCAHSAFVAAEPYGALWCIPHHFCL